MSMVGALGWFLFVLVGSVLCHEYAHVLAARSRGWTPAGWRFYWYGVGYAFVPREGRGDTWRIALAGLLASALLASVGYVLVPASWLFDIVFKLNLAILFVNALPVPGTDGWHVWRALRGKA